MAKVSTPLTGAPDPWDTRFGFFWYNDREIFHATQEDLNHQAEALADAGINHVITFSCTHFRWSFHRHWGLLAEILARVVEACHLHGIRVTEHHSCHLTFNPLDAEGESLIERVLKGRGSSLESWPQLRRDCDADPVMDGVRLSSFRQIDGRTGRWARSSYQGWCMCFNNPFFLRAYCAYLETLYATGIDGIMTDDVQWFGEGHACACEYCRRLFAVQTGYEFPHPGPGWDAWYGDYDDLSYVAWLDFRFRSNEGFHRAIKEHYESLGLRPLRPNYVSAALNRNWTAYTLERLPDLDWVFQECCFSYIIRYSWPSWAVEAYHRFAVGRRRGIPSMAMFYPDRPDTMLFTWGLAMSWGGMYLATPEGRSLNQEEKRLRDFEKRHAPLLRGPHRLARLGFYDSRLNRNLYGDAESRSLAGLRTWIQACYRNNVPCDLFQMEELERLADYRVVVLNEVALLAADELVALRSFVVNGGILVWCGRTGTRDEKGGKREKGWAGRGWGLEELSGTEDGGEISEHRIGSGRLVLVPGDRGLGPYEGNYNANRWQEEEVRVPFRAVSQEEKESWRQIVELLLDLLPGGEDLEVGNLPEGVMVTAYEASGGDALAVHLVNAAGTLDVAAGTLVGHDDPIPFPEHAGKGRIRVRKPRGGTVDRAVYLDPERDDEVPLDFEDGESSVLVAFEPHLLRGYGLVKIELLIEEDGRSL